MTDQSVQSTSTTTQTGDIVARAGRYYRNTRYIMFALLLGMGGWFLYDGFIGWPNENAKIAQLNAAEQAAKDRGDQAEVGRLAAEKKNYTAGSVSPVASPSQVAR